MLDPFTVLEIDLEAISHCIDRPDFDQDLAPGAQMTDDDYRAGIRKVFADADGMEESLVDPILREFKDEKAMEQVASDLASAIVGNMFGY